MHEPFPWNLLISFLLHLQFYQTGLDELDDTLHRFYLLASLSTYAKSIHQISFLNLAKAFIRLNLRVARVNFVQEGFECKNFSPLILTNSQFSLSCAQTHKQHHPVCTAFAASDVQILKATQLPLSFVSAFWFSIRVGDTPAATSKVK